MPRRFTPIMAISSAKFSSVHVVDSLAKRKITYENSESTESLIEKLSQFYADRTFTGSAIKLAYQAEAIFR